MEQMKPETRTLEELKGSAPGVPKSRGRMVL